MEIFSARQAIERLRVGLFDPLAVKHLTMEDDSFIAPFLKGLQDLEEGKSGHLCICGSYGQGKSHSLNYLKQQALSQGYATSLVQLDARETPFHRFSVVYKSLMQNLSLPTGESLCEAWATFPSEELDDMPDRFRLILQAVKKKFSHWLEEALMGSSLPNSSLKQMLKARQIDQNQKESLLLRGNGPYVQMVQSLGKLLHRMGHKGWVLLFDEAEAIAQGSLGSRVKSYDILHQFFTTGKFVYPIFAFTQTFFDKVRSEEYGSETSRFPRNYAQAWDDLQIIRLQDFSLARWEIVLDRLIDLYGKAYRVDFSTKQLDIKQQMRALLEKLKAQETRFKLKALIHQLDLVSLKAAS